MDEAMIQEETHFFCVISAQFHPPTIYFQWWATCFVLQATFSPHSSANSSLQWCPGIWDHWAISEGNFSMPTFCFCCTNEIRRKVDLKAINLQTMLFWTYQMWHKTVISCTGQANCRCLTKRKKISWAFPQTHLEKNVRDLQFYSWEVP